MVEANRHSQTVRGRVLRNVTSSLPPVLGAVLAAGTLAWWLADTPPLPEHRVPQADDTSAGAGRSAAILDAAESPGDFTPGRAASGTTRQNWPQFRGPLRDNIARPETPLADAWPPEGPPVRWMTEVGDGHAGPVVHDGRVYLLDYDEQRRGDAVRCLSFADGGEIWRRFYPVHTKRNHGISRTVPAIAGRNLVTLGPQCQVRGVDAVTGEHRWSIDLPARYGTRVPLWYAGQCPLIDGQTVVVAVGGERVLAAGFDCTTGQVEWETPNPGGWQMSHASLAVATFHGVRQYICTSLGGIAGIGADGGDRGRILWSVSSFSPNVIAPTPVPLPGNRFLQTAGHGSGSAWFDVRRTAAGVWEAVETRRFDRRTFACEQQTPILRNGVLLTVLPSDAVHHRQELTCMNLSGEILWHSGPQDRFALGPFLGVGDDRMLLLGDTGVLTLARATPDGYVRLARHTLFADGRDAWGPMALVDGLLLLRDSTRLLCIDLR